jgi:hypothetical protein
MTYRPTNRNVTELIPIPDGEALAGPWFVDDVTDNGAPRVFGCGHSEYRVLEDRQGKRGGWVVCSRRGYFVRHPRRSRRSPGIRYFKTPAAAAAFAEAMDK